MKSRQVGFGLDCPKCGRTMIRYEHKKNWRPKKNQPYYFRYWDWCESCKRNQQYEAAKVFVPAKNSRLDNFNYVGYFDGSCERNPGGPIGWSAIVYDSSGKLIWKSSDRASAQQGNSNNVAEYLGLQMLLDYFLQNHLNQESILVKGDSMLVIKQMFSHWRIKGGYYASTARKVQGKIQRFTSLRGIWVPRRENTEADTLSRVPYTDFLRAETPTQSNYGFDELLAVSVDPYT